MHLRFHALRFGLITAALSASLLLLAHTADAATITWDGGGGDNNWSTAENWDTDSVPGSGDIARFNGTSTKDATIDASFAGEINQLSILSGYTGTITQARSLTATSISQADGTFTGGSDTIDITTFTLSGGTFTSTSGTMTVGGAWTHTAGGTFAHNSGTVEYDGGAATWNFDIGQTGSGEFYDFTFNGTHNATTSIATGDVLFVENDLRLVEGRLSGDQVVDVQGDVTVESGFDGGTLDLAFGGSNDQNFDLTGATDVFQDNIAVDKTGGTVTMLSDLVMDNNKSFDVINGSINFSSYDFSQNNAVTVSGGNYLGGGGTHDIDGNITISGGTMTASSGTTYFSSGFTHTAGGTFAHNNGTFYFDGSTATWDFNSALDGSGEFYNFTFNNTANTNTTTISAGDTVLAENDMLLIDGRLNNAGSIFEVRGDFTMQTDFDPTSTIDVLFTGTNDQNLDVTNAEDNLDKDVTINKASGTVTLLSDLTLDSGLNQNLIVQEGSLDLNGNNLTVNNGSSQFTIQDGGVLIQQGGETLTVNGGNPQLDTGSTWTYDGTSGTTTITDYSYHHLTIDGSGGTFQLGANESISGTLTVSAGAFDANDYTMEIDENTVVSGGTFKTGTNTISFGDAGDDSVTISSGELQIESDNTPSDIDINASTWTNSGGTISFVASSVVTEVPSAISPYNNLTINGASSIYNLNGAVDVNGDVTLTAGTFGIGLSNYAMTVGGSWTDNSGASFDQGAGTVTFDGTGTITADEAFYNVVINSSGTLTLGAALDMNGSLTLTAGTLDVSGSNYGVNVSLSWTDSGSATFTAREGTVTFDGTGTINANDSFYNVTINSDGNTLSLGGNIDVDNHLTITAGTFDVSASNYSVTLGGNFANSGTFTQRSGTVTLDTAGTTSVISGSNTFYNLSSSTASKAIQFTAGTTQTVSNQLTLTGSAGNLISLRSTSDDTEWNLAVSGSASVTYVDVKDSDASTSASAIDPGDNSTDSGNNTNWSFNDEPTAASVTASFPTDGTGNVTISVQLDDTDDDTLQFLVQYNVGDGWTKATLSESSGDVTSTFGTPTVENDNSYQVASVITSSGANTVTVVWNSQTDEATADLSSALVRVTPYDETATGTAASSSAFTMDNVAPVGLADLSVSHDDSTVIINWTAVTSETNFASYQIWYGSSQGNVEARSGGGVTSITLYEMSQVQQKIFNMASTNYFYKIFAFDDYGNSASSDTVNHSTFAQGGGGSSSTTNGSSGGGGSSSSSSSSDDSEEVADVDDSEEEEEVLVADDEDTEEESSEDEEEEETLIADTDDEDEVDEEVEEETVIEEVEESEEEAEEEVIEIAIDVEFDVPLAHWSASYLEDFQNSDGFDELVAADGAVLDVIGAAFDRPDEVIKHHEANTLMSAFLSANYNIQDSNELLRSEGIELVLRAIEIEIETKRRGKELLNMYGLVVPPFGDVDFEGDLAPYIVLAYSEEIVVGYGDGSYRPDQGMTYAEFVKVLTLAMEL